MELFIKMFNSLLIVFVWMELDRNGRCLVRTFPYNMLIIAAGLLKVYINVLTEIANPILEICQIVLVSILTCILEKKLSIFSPVGYSLNYILAKGIWLVGSSLSTMILSIIKKSDMPYMIAIVSCVPILFFLQLMRKLLQDDIELLDKKLVTIITAVAWVIYSISCDLLAVPYTGEDKLVRGYALLTVSLLFVILTIFTVKAVSNERNSRKLIKHIDELVRTAHRSKELIPAIAQEIYMMQVDMQHGETSRLKERITAALEEVVKLQQEMSIETQFSYLIEQNFSTTGLDILDSQLMSEQLRALQHRVNFEVVVNSPITPLIDIVISQLHIQRLIGDLYRDALAATEGCVEVKEIMLIMGMVNGNYQIRMCDTGLLFPPEVLNNLGVTFRASGRNHYGYADIFETLDKCLASIYVEEYSPNERMFTKAITVRFDGLAKLQVKSFRPEILDREINISLVVEENMEREMCLR